MKRFRVRSSGYFYIRETSDFERSTREKTFGHCLGELLSLYLSSDKLCARAIDEMSPISNYNARVRTCVFVCYFFY